KNAFYNRLGYSVNLKNPNSFNEKVVWKKIHDRNPLLPIITDKYQVRSYIKNLLGGKKAQEILIPLLYITDKPETIPFDELPAKYIIKPNNAAGRRIIVEDSIAIDKEDIIKTCKRWMKIPYGLAALEWSYIPVKRRIIIEKLLRDDNGKTPKELKFFMFHGKCKAVYLILDKLNTPFRSYYDEKWNILPVRKPNRLQGKKIEKPKNYEEMVMLAEKLSKPFDFLRVDLYNLDGKIWFGELTNYPYSGKLKFIPESFDYELGKYWKIEPEYWKNNNKI
ncbi:MAG: ATP-grasp fold amidoligase family protein, partial [Atribacterota bacterium]|nr:ATP-grasp fold amidoligase family protein [Atribacterota bacterium]